MPPTRNGERPPRKFLNLRAWQAIVSETASKWWEHDAMTQSAALAFYTLFSLAPILTVVTSTAGLVFGVDVVRGRVVSEFHLSGFARCRYSLA